MRRALLLLVTGASGCYAPKVAEGVACAPQGTDRCPSGQVCVTRGGLEVCEPAGATSDDAGVDASADDAMGDGPGVDGAVPAGWWNPAWTHRRAIDVRSGANGAPAGYTLSVTFDHLGLVAASQSKPNGDDVRIVRGDGTEVARVLDSGAAWNSAVTKLWFPNSDAMLFGSTTKFWLYWGNLGAGAPPASASAVFEFADDFESGLGAWTADAGVGTNGVHAHRGAKAAQVGPLNAVVTAAYANGLNERDLAFDVWWYLDDANGVDAFSGVRCAANEQYFTDLQSPGNGAPSTWDISRNLDGDYAELVPPPLGAAPVAAGAWTRVTIYAYQDRMAVDVNGARYVPTSGFATIPDATLGTVGIGGYYVASHLWFDDATVRRLALPEPTVSLGAVESLP